MHELSIAGSLLDTIANEQLRHGFTRVTRVRVRIGALSNIVTESLVFGFDALSAGTPAEGAVLECEIVPARAQCASCGASFTPTETDVRCTECGSGAVRLQTGEELEFVSIDTV